MASPLKHTAPADDVVDRLVASEEFGRLLRQYADALLADPDVPVEDPRLAEAAILGGMREVVTRSARSRVRQARADDVTWREVGEAFGIPASNAYTRFSSKGINRNRRRKRVDD